MALPIASILDEIRAALDAPGVVVVQAAPGAGKTTGVPPALLGEPWLGGRRILLLEPRRLAARAAARRMALLRGEPVGRTVGYRTRLDTRVSRETRIEVVTEGILTRLVQDDPTLDGTGLVIFDEFHERSLQGDIGLALVLQSRALVRPDLRIAVMSATIDGTAVARLLDDAPIVRSTGRAFEVETRYRPAPPGTRRLGTFDAGFVAAVVHEAIAQARGDTLVFLPGASEIARVESVLDVPDSVDVFALHGTLSPDAQDRAIAPSPAGRRKVVLSTSIAETSLTIEGIGVVIDSGLARRPRFSPRTGMTRLDTVRVSRAAADQRRGRAGRLGPGICYRLWAEEDNAGLQAFDPPEILEADLASLALELAAAGIQRPVDLSWLDPPPAAAYDQAVELLQWLDALDHAGRLTTHGAAMVRLGMHPRLSHMVLRGVAMGHAALACEVAAVLGERDPLRAIRDTVGCDLRTRIDALHHPRQFAGADVGVMRRAAEQARRWQTQLPAAEQAPLDSGAVGRLAALAYPDRLAQRRPGGAARYLLRNGTGAVLPDGDPLGTEPWLVIVDSNGRAPEALAWLAASLGAGEVDALFGHQARETERVEWTGDGRLRAWRERALGALVLIRTPVRDPDPALAAAAVADAIRRRGLDALPWTEAAIRLRQRLAFLHAHDSTWPDVSDDALLGRLAGAIGADSGDRPDGLHEMQVARALMEMLSPGQRQRLDRLAPTHFEAPTGSRVPVDYSDPAAPSVSIRLQELFGSRDTPTVLGGRVALTLQLLSPAQRPVQVTRDLAGFWQTAYHDVRKDLRARYPRHSWPEDPLRAVPTRRATPRKRST